MAEAHALGPLASGAEENFGSARVRVLLEEVVLDLPHVLDPELVASSIWSRASASSCDSLNSSHGRGELVLVEDAEISLVSRPKLLAAYSRVGLGT